jgi:hypothetical protein
MAARVRWYTPFRQPHEEEGRQTDTEQRERRAERAAEAVARENRDVRCVKAGERIADRRHLQELVVFEPFFLANEGVAQIRDHAAAEADRADLQEDQEQIDE